MNFVTTTEAVQWRNQEPYVLAAHNAQPWSCTDSDKMQAITNRSSICVTRRRLAWALRHEQTQPYAAWKTSVAAPATSCDVELRPLRCKDMPLPLIEDSWIPKRWTTSSMIRKVFSPKELTAQTAPSWLNWSADRSESTKSQTAQDWNDLKSSVLDESAVSACNKQYGKECDHACNSEA